jgi:hypothetical protein
MRNLSYALAFSAAIGLAAPALAQDGARQFDDLDATRINPFQILIEFEYDGGACEAVGQPELGELVDGTLAVTFPTSSTSEMCTMQVVEIDVRYAIATEETVSQIDVTLNAPDGRTIGTGSARVEQD